MGYKYYLRKDVYSEKGEMKFTLTIDNINVPFNSINIYEIDNYFYDYGSYLSQTYKEVSISKEKDKLALSFSYKTKNTNVDYLMIEFSPNYNINYLEVNYKIIKTDIILICISCISIIFLIIILIMFICKICRINDLDISRLKKNSEDRKLLPSPLSANNSNPQNTTPEQ